MRGASRLQGLGTVVAAVVLPLAGLAACGSGDEHRLFLPHVGVDDFEYGSLQDLLDGSGLAVVIRIDGHDETIVRDYRDPLGDIDVFRATVVDRLVGAVEIPDVIRLATALLEDEEGPLRSSTPPHRVDREVWVGDREFLLFLIPFRLADEIWPDTFASIGGFRGIFVRPAGSQDAFRPIVAPDLALAAEVRLADVLALTPGGRPPDPDEY